MDPGEDKGFEGEVDDGIERIHEDQFQVTKIRFTTRDRLSEEKDLRLD